MRKFILVPLIALVAGLTACGSSTETTVIKKETATPSSTTTTEATTDEWPQYMQDAFLKGCADYKGCECALDQLMQTIPASEFNPSGDVVARYRSQMMDAIGECL